jgi:hypothetical protein
MVKGGQTHSGEAKITDLVIEHLKKKKKEKTSLTLHNLTHFLQIPPNVQKLTLVYQSLIYFHFFPSVRISCEILKNRC